MKNKYIFWLAAVALTTSSCLKDLETGVIMGKDKGNIPISFNWKTTRDVSLSVALPTANGQAVNYAVVRVYKSPLLLESNILAKGAIDQANPTFRTAITVPAGTQMLYVKLTLPNGKASVKAVAVTGDKLTVNSSSISSPKAQIAPMAIAAATRKASAMPTDYPALAIKGAADFSDAKTVISTTPAKKYPLGSNDAQWNAGQVAAKAYYIPAGAVVNGNIDLNGGQGANVDPVLYVAGTLEITGGLQIGHATIAVLDGGVVNIAGALTAQTVQQAKNAAIYVFKGGKITAGSVNLSCENVVNGGEFEVKSLIDFNSKLTFYNLADGVIKGKNATVASNVFHNDGQFIVDDKFTITSGSSKFNNHENGDIKSSEMVIEGNQTLNQNGKLVLDELRCRGTANIGCYTSITYCWAENAFVNIASGGCLDTKTIEFYNIQMDMAEEAMLIVDDYNPKGLGNNKINANKKNDKVALFIIHKTAQIAGKTQFSGPIEVVYNQAGLDDKYQIEEKQEKNHFKDAAYLTPTQITYFEGTECNGISVVPDPKPEGKPEDGENVGSVLTYCFEDNWPWMGDYDMNDIVLKSNIVLKTTTDGSKVKTLTFNWELLASGAINRIAMGFQLDKILKGQVANVETTHNKFGAGPFAANGLEENQRQAVVTLFNSIEETQDAGVNNFNTTKNGKIIATKQNSTTIIFTEPIDISLLQGNSFNVFIVVNKVSGALSRDKEIHMPTFKNTDLGHISPDFTTLLPSDPFKYYDAKDNKSGNNGMMWGLMIPGDFSYPAERKDIRDTYKFFTDWTVSGGTEHDAWYNEELDAELVY